MAHFRSRAEPRAPACGPDAVGEASSARRALAAREPDPAAAARSQALEGGQPALPAGAQDAEPAAPATSWQAALTLDFEVRQQRSVLARAEHRGPLRVQRPFYPERDGTCHVYLLHPPGGVASGDELCVRARLAGDARALVTTPGAGKFYRARDGQAGAPRVASVSQRLSVGPGARLEWFPQESIVFEGAEARVATQLELAAGAVFAGWDIVCLGRPACGEAFRRGELRTELALHVEGRLRYMERGRYRGGDRSLYEAWGLGGAPVFGTFLVVHPLAGDAWLEPLRAQIAPEAGLFGVTLVSGVIAGRYLGASTLDARACFERMFRLLRPHYAQTEAVAPRIWST